MSNNNLPSYQDLFGQLNFKKGTDARSVYSPAAYLADLLQLIDDTFQNPDLDIRRPDIKKILLNEENTFDMVPYLDIVNEILERLVVDIKGAIPPGEEWTSDQIKRKAYDILKEAAYPMNLPFDLEHEQLYQHLDFLNIELEELFHAFAAEGSMASQHDTSYLNTEGYPFKVTKASYEFLFENGKGAGQESIENLYNLTAEESAEDLKVVSRFLAATGISSEDLLGLLYGNLSPTAKNESGKTELDAAGAFYQNLHIEEGCFTLDEAEERIVFKGSGAEGDHDWPGWLRRVHFLISVSNVTGYSIQEVELIARSSSGWGYAGSMVAQRLAYLKAFTKRYDVAADEAVALLGWPLNTIGIGDEHLPMDLFNRIFNHHSSSIHKAYIAGSEFVPPAFAGYKALRPVPGSLLDEGNKDLSTHLSKALGISKKDFETIVTRYEDRQNIYVEHETCLLFEEGSDPMRAYLLLYRIVKLSELFEISIEDFLDMLDILNGDPHISMFSKFGSMHGAEGGFLLSTHMLLEPGAWGGVDGWDQSAWLVLLMSEITQWAEKHEFSVSDLRFILRGEKREKQTNGSQQLLMEQQAEKNNQGEKLSAHDKAKIAVYNALYQKFKLVVPGPAMFLGKPVDQRTANLLARALKKHPDLVVAGHPDILHFEKEVAQDFAHAMIHSLPKVTAHDFKGLGISELLLDQLYEQLVVLRYLETDGRLIPANFPEKAEDFVIASDLSQLQEATFFFLNHNYNKAEEKGQSPVELNFAISDMGQAPFSELQKLELHKRLVYNGYTTEAGNVTEPSFFGDEENLAQFNLSLNFEVLAPEIHQKILEKIEAFEKEELVLRKDVFDELGLEEEELDELMENLQFNDYLDTGHVIVDKEGIFELVADDLKIALPFYPYRHKILAAIQEYVLDYKHQFIRIKKEDLGDLAEELTGRLLLKDLIEGGYLPESQVLGDDEDRFFSKDENVSDFELSPYFNSYYKQAVFRKLAEIAKTVSTLRFAPQSVTDLDYSPEQFSAIKHLLEKYNFTKNGHILTNELGYFLNENNRLDLDLEGYEQEGENVFSILHQIAKSVQNWTAHVSSALQSQATQQEELIYEQLQESLGLDLPVVRVILEEMVGRESVAVHFLVPVLERVNALGKVQKIPKDHYFNLTYQRIEQFAHLCNHLNLTAEEARAAFIDQGLVDKFREGFVFNEQIWSWGDGPIEILPFPNGPIYVFKYDWTDRKTYYKAFDPHTYEEIVGKQPLSGLSENLAEVEKIDAAFVDTHQIGWLIAGSACYYFDHEEEDWVLKKDKKIGVVNNPFEDPDQIDAAITNEKNQLFLFVGDQYIRYSNPTPADIQEMDEGYPKPIKGNWAAEFGVDELPEAFHDGVDAAFRDQEGVVYFFKGEHYVSSKDFSQALLINDRWGQLKHTYEGEAVQASFMLDGKFVLFSGPLVMRYSGNIENPNTIIDEGFPKLITNYVKNLPAPFHQGIDAALQISSGGGYLFKDELFVEVDAHLNLVPDSNGVTVRNNGNFWGIVDHPFENNPTPSPLVSAALLGLDGMAYVFSGDQYFRYSGEQYGTVDEGYPKKIEGDWGGLTTVDAAFVMDGKTYLFGAYTEQNSTSAGTPSIDKTGYVCYTTNDYSLLEEGYPKPVDDNWWNLPFELLEQYPTFEKPDAVFIGKDEKTYLFSGQHYVYFEHNERWWSEPEEIKKKWRGLPEGFTNIEAAFTGKDSKTYLFVGDQFVRYTNEDFSKIDEGYPRSTATSWGRVVNNFQRKEIVDAALFMVAEVPETTPDSDTEDSKTDKLAGTAKKNEAPKMKQVAYSYLFSGSQYIRYTDQNYAFVDEGYPKNLDQLKSEPRFNQIQHSLVEGFDSICADHRSLYIFKDGKFITNVDQPYQHYTDMHKGPILSAIMDSGKLYLENSDGWGVYPYNDVQSETKPELLNGIPAEFQSGLDAVLQGTDGNTYFFKGDRCYNRLLEKAYPLADEWGRPEINVQLDEGIDAILVGKDQKLYVFSGGQYQTYKLPLEDKGPELSDKLYAESYPHSIAEDFGLESVVLAYADGEYTHFFGKPDENGVQLHLVITGEEYDIESSRAYYETDISWWNIPEEYISEGFDTIEAVLFEEDNMYLINNNEFIQYNKAEDYWSFPKPLQRIYPELPEPNEDFGTVRTAFTANNQRTYFFSKHTFLSINKEGQKEGAPLKIKEYWGKIKNNLQARKGLEAAFVFDNNTYLFSGDQYVRYSGFDYEFIDPDYPKPILGNLRMEPGFKLLPELFEEVLEEMFVDGAGQFDEVISNGRNLYIFIGDDLHVFANDKTAELDLSQLTKAKNHLLSGKKVDAAIHSGDKEMILFSGDQFYFYTDEKGELTLKEGYPKDIYPNLEQDYGFAIPNSFRDGIDAGCSLNDYSVCFFKGKDFWFSETGSSTPIPIKDNWGKIHNNFQEAPTGVDAVMHGLDGFIYAFKGDQFVRYSDFNNEYVDTGYPKPLEGHWGGMAYHMPPEQIKVDSAFSFEQKSYLCFNGSGMVQFVRFSDPTYQRMDDLYPRGAWYHWRSRADYYLIDIKTIADFKALSDQFADKSYTLTDFVNAVTGLKEQPYAALAETFGEDLDKVQWLKRNNAFLTVQGRYETRFNMEAVLKMYEIFRLCAKVGHSPEALYESLWLKLFDTMNDLDKFNDVLPFVSPEVIETTAHFLQTVNSEADWNTLKRQMHDEMNLKKRDALVGYVLAHQNKEALSEWLKEQQTLAQQSGGSPIPAGQKYIGAPNINTRDLYGELLIDIEMGNEMRTSKVKEAIAATQLFIHRYLVHLEDPNTKDEEFLVRQELKNRWVWLKNYRVWEANRKVFLYPENYIRPELRDTKTPAFQKLEEDLLQGEMSEELVTKAFKNYLDEYTEVSRLTIAGGYVYNNLYTPDDLETILFGRTKTDPMRYYYREATFVGGATEHAAWKAWTPMEIQINAARVYPVYAFGRIFVFWATLEQTSKSSNTGAVQVKSSGEDTQEVRNSTETEYLLQIHYSFYDLNKQWKAPQLLKVKNSSGMGGQPVSIISNNIPIVAFRLHVQNAEQLDGNQHENIEISCEYAQEYTVFKGFTNEHPDLPGFKFPHPVFPKFEKERKTHITTFHLTPELYVHQVSEKSGSLPQITPESHFYRVIHEDEPMTQDRMVALGTPVRFKSKGWFTFDHKGGSFLVKPVVGEETEPAAIPVKQVKDYHSKLPNTWTNLDAAFEIGGITYLFRGGKYTSSDDFSKIKDISLDWGRKQVDFPSVDTIFQYKTSNGKDSMVLFSGNSYQLLSESATSPLSGNSYYFPSLGKVEAAVRFGGKNFFFQNNNYLISDSLQTPRSVQQDWKVNSSITHVRGVIRHNNEVIVVGKDQFIRYGKDDLNTPIATPQTTNLGNLLQALGYQGSLTNPQKGKEVKSVAHTQDGQIVIQTDKIQYLKDGKLVDTYKPADTIPKVPVSIAGIEHTTLIKANNVNPSLLQNSEGSGNLIADTPKWPFQSLGVFYASGNDSSIWIECGDRIVVTGSKDAKAFLTTSDETKRAEEIRASLIEQHSRNQMLTAHFEWAGTTYLFYDKLLIEKPQNGAVVAHILSAPVTGALITGDNKLRLFSSESYWPPMDLSELDGTKVRQYMLATSKIFGSSNEMFSVSHDWGNSKPVTAAFAHNGQLYLIKQDEYATFSDVSNDTKTGTYQGDTTKLSEFNDKLPASWKQIDGAFFWPLGSSNPKLHLISGQQIVGEEVTSVQNWLKQQSSNGNDGPSRVDAAYASDQEGIVLLSGDQVYFYGLTNDPQNPWALGENYPVTDPDASGISAASYQGGSTYFFKGNQFAAVNGFSKDVIRPNRSVASEFPNMHPDFKGNFSAVLNASSNWIFFKGNQYVAYDDNNLPTTSKSRVYDNYDIIRLTASTAVELNTRLFAGGMNALLNRQTQELDELPRFSGEETNWTTIKFKKNKVDRYPVSSHLDFTSANGIYYKEIFFHAPYLLAQHLNGSQKFEEAKRWYEYIYDPTEAEHYWQYLPFVGLDIQALVNGLLSLKEDLQDQLASDLQERIDLIAKKLETLIPAFTGKRLPTDSEKALMDDLHWISEHKSDDRKFNPYYVIDELNELSGLEPEAEQQKQSLVELLELVGPIRYRWEQLRDSTDAQIKAYLDDPFDPHTLANLRPVAYRKAIVMAYVDNLLDWGDMLFRQYTRESINEARMLYVLAYDLLGQKPANMGRLKLEAAMAYADGTEGLDNANTSDYDFLLGIKGIGRTSQELGLAGQGLSHGASDSVMSVAANPYFYVPDNFLFLEYWDRVEDRLYKIRHSLNILGVKQPLPLFQPPIDPMALVRAVAGGMPLSAAISGLHLPVPHYRFRFMLDRAKELVGQVTQFGDALLAALEKKDAEELTLLQNRQEGIILKMNRQIRQAQLEDAILNTKVLEETKNSTQIRLEHFEELIDEGFFLGEQIQMGIIAAGAAMMGISAIIKTASSLPRAAPEAYVGPFIAGVSHGGGKVGDIIEAIGEGLETGGDAVSMLAEIPAIIANQQRQEMDWEMEKALALSELVQLDYQIEGARLQEQIARYEIDLLEKEIEHQEETAKFMRDKFTNAQLYQWQIGRLSGLYYQTYKLAYDVAKQAERAYQFERAASESDTSFIQPNYWDSRRKGLLAGESLQLDLNRMEHAFMQSDQRRLEVRKPISLLEHNPLAFLDLKTKRSCEFFLNEALFAYDFPGHYCRQIKSVSVTFDIQPNLHRTVFATLTQLSHHTVTKPDSKAVKFMLDPKGQPPQSIRSNWRDGQQIAISRIQEDNGILDSFPDQERYEHFEGTGAVSRWRLEINGSPGDSLDIANLEDVIINVEYTALQGGQAYADSIKGLLKPYPTTTLLDLSLVSGDNWLDFLDGDTDTLTLPLTRDLFPNMSGGKVSSIYLFVEADGDSRGNVQLNQDEELTLKHQHILKPGSLNIGRNGSTWQLTYSGDRSELQNISLVVGYRAKVG